MKQHKELKVMFYPHAYAVDVGKLHAAISSKEIMDMAIIPVLEDNLFTFSQFQHLDNDWKPSNEFEQWVDTKLFIRCDVPIYVPGYGLVLHYANGYLASATATVGDYSFRYQQKEMGWTRQ